MARRTLLFVAAHPDDDAFSIAGSVALLAADPRLRFVLLHATDGEAGEVAADVQVAGPEALGALRREEDERAWEVVGRSPDRHEWFGLPDGGLPDLPAEALVERIASVMAEERPDVVTTFGPDGVTGHPDHRAISEATTAAFSRFARDGGPGFQRLLYSCIPRSALDRWNRNRRTAGVPEWDPEQPFHLRGVPDEQVGVDVDISSVTERVVAGIRAHRSQWSYSVSADDGQLLGSLRRETWVVAWPARGLGAPVLGHLFEDLD